MTIMVIMVVTMMIVIYNDDDNNDRQQGADDGQMDYVNEEWVKFPKRGGYQIKRRESLYKIFTLKS